MYNQSIVSEPSNLTSEVTPSFTFLTSATLFLIVYLSVSRFKRTSASVDLPPSPPADPVIGHVRVMSSDYQWKTFAEWSKKLGDVIYLSIIGRPIVVLNSAEAARDLMDKRSANYSDRPRIVVIGEMLGWGNMLSFLRYGDRFRKQRRMMQKAFNSQAVTSFRELQTTNIKSFLLGLLDQPGNVKNLTNRLMGATILKATYGHDVVSDEDRYTTLAVEAASCAVASGVPGAPLVDLFPFLRHIPKWFPGAEFKRAAEHGRKLTEQMINVPFNDVLRQRKSGVVVPCLINSLLDEYEAQGIKDPDHELNIKNATGIIYAAGVETTEIVATTFFLMMVRHPEVVERAQAEIDSVVGSHRLPNLDDREKLPYIDCIVKELLRINPPAPLCVPHQSIDEDVYRGKRIPGGSLIIPNIWCMMRDPRFFPDAEAFKPERFFDKVKTNKNVIDSLNGFSLDDPSSIIFGFGRRICPGRHFADASAWLLVSDVLAVFDIRPRIDPKTGVEILPEVKYTSGFASHPLPFDCRIIPRSETHAKLIREVNLY